MEELLFWFRMSIEIREQEYFKRFFILKHWTNAIIDLDEQLRTEILFSLAYLATGFVWMQGSDSKWSRRFKLHNKSILDLRNNELLNEHIEDILESVLQTTNKNTA